MQGDDRSRVQIQALDLQKINEALRKLSDQIARIEGRSGPVGIRDSITVQSSQQTLIDFESTESGNAAIVAYGTENATIAFAKGARKDNNGEWIATDTSATIWALDRSGNGVLYANSGLTSGQAFSPTLAFTFGTGGSYVLKSGDTMTGALTIPDLGDTTPSIRFTGDTNTGIAYESSDQYVLLANGAAQFRVGNGYCTVTGTLYHGDIYFRTYVSSSNPIILVDDQSGTDYFSYIRSTNSFATYIAGSPVLSYNNTSAVWYGASWTFSSGTAYSPEFILENTNADANQPYFKFVKNSASPASGDALGLIGFVGKDSAGNQDFFAYIYGVCDDYTSGSEDGSIVFSTSSNGSPYTTFKLDSGAVRSYYTHYFGNAFVANFYAAAYTSNIPLLNMGDYLGIQCRDDINRFHFGSGTSDGTYAYSHGAGAAIEYYYQDYQNYYYVEPYLSHLLARPICGTWWMETSRAGAGWYIWDYEQANSTGTGSGTALLSRANAHGTANDAIKTLHTGWYKVTAQLMGYDITAATNYRWDLYVDNGIVASWFAHGHSVYANAVLDKVVYISAGSTVAVYTDCPSRHGGQEWSHISLEKLN